MPLITQLVIAMIALEHFYILWLEMFAWTTPRGRKAFPSIPPELFQPTKVLAANQGLYNGFLSVGLIWSLLITDAEWSQNIALYFLACIAVAGMYGGFTAGKKILMIQTLPAVLAIVMIYFLPLL